MSDSIQDSTVLTKSMLQSQYDEPAFSDISEIRLPFRNNPQSLAKDLQFGSVGDLQAWLSSKLFNQYWQVFKTECLDARHADAAVRGAQLRTGESYKDVVAALEMGERNGLQKYSDDFVDKDDWTSIDHAAYFLYRCTNANLKNRNGAFFGKEFSLDAARHAIWQAKMYMTDITQSSKLRSSTSAPTKSLTPLGQPLKSGSWRQENSSEDDSSSSKRQSTLPASPNPGRVEDDVDPPFSSLLSDTAETNKERAFVLDDPQSLPDSSDKKSEAGNRGDEGAEEESEQQTQNVVSRTDWEAICGERGDRPFNLKLR